MFSGRRRHIDRGRNLRRIAVDCPNPPSYVEITSPRETLADVLDRAVREVDDAVRAVEHDDARIVPPPFCPMPVPFAAPALVIEYGFHRHDLDTALGWGAALAPEVSAVHLELLPFTLTTTLRSELAISERSYWETAVLQNSVE